MSDADSERLSLTTNEGFFHRAMSSEACWREKGALAEKPYGGHVVVKKKILPR